MNIFFSGIGGVGIGPLAEIALDAGYDVQGSDIKDGPVLSQLRHHNIPVAIGQDGSFLQERHALQPIDWFVYTSALPDTHPELILAKQLGIKTAKRDELLAYIIQEKQLKLIAVAGTHGKTTTTAMIVWLFRQLGLPLSWSIGTTLSFGPSGKFDPQSQYFIYECDEFDRNFLHFSPYLSLITSIGYDHPDIYPTEVDYLAAFSQFIKQSNQTIMWRDDASKVLPDKNKTQIIDKHLTLTVGLAGEHNRRNATLASKALSQLRPEFSGKAVEILNDFPGAQRRFERLAENIYSDYAVHPTEIASTLQLAREISNHVMLIYQPHQNIRQHEMRDRYTDCFELAESIYWLPTYQAREDPALPLLSPEELTENITNKEAVHTAAMNDELWNTIQQARHNNILVIIMGAGDIDLWARTKLAALPLEN